MLTLAGQRRLLCSVEGCRRYPTVDRLVLKTGDREFTVARAGIMSMDEKSSRDEGIKVFGHGHRAQGLVSNRFSLV